MSISSDFLFSERVVNVWNYLPYDIVCFNNLTLSNAVLYVLILNRFYNVTSLVHSYMVISVFLGLVSGLLLVHSGAF